MINRRSFLIGLIAAPVIIRSGILMPIKVIEPVKVFTIADYEKLMNRMIEDWQKKIADCIIYGSDTFQFGGNKFWVDKDTLLNNEEIYK